MFPEEISSSLEMFIPYMNSHDDEVYAQQQQENEASPYEKLAFQSLKIY